MTVATIAAPSSGARLALVLWTGEVGGAQTFAAGMAEQLGRVGVAARLVFVGEPVAMAARLQARGVDHRCLGMARGRDVVRHPRRYAAAVRAAGPDGAILGACGLMGGALRAGGYKAPIVAIEQGPFEAAATPGDRALEYLRRAFGAWAHDVEVPVSEHVAAGVRRRPHARRVQRIHTAVDPVRYEGALPTGDRPPTFGFGGRLIAGKGVEGLLRAFARVRRAHPVRLRLAGAGPEEPRLRVLAGELGLDGACELAGAVGDMAAFWHGCDVAVIPSGAFVEACPMAAIEAMACGRPVIATRNGGLPEIVRDGETGLLVAPGDERALQSALAAYAADPALARAHGEAARARARAHFALDGCARAYLGLLGL